MIQKKGSSIPKEKDILVASIDIGTNSTHLLIAEINLELKTFSIKLCSSFWNVRINGWKRSNGSDSVHA